MVYPTTPSVTTLVTHAIVSISKLTLPLGTACYSSFPTKDLDAFVIVISNSLSVINQCHICMSRSKGCLVSLECLCGICFVILCSKLDMVCYMLKLCKSLSCLEWTYPPGCVCPGVTRAVVCRHCTEVSCFSVDTLRFGWGLVYKMVSVQYFSRWSSFGAVIQIQSLLWSILPSLS